MLNTIVMFLSLSVSSASAPATHCETVGPRIDGISVTICDGRVKSMTDASGNVVAYPSSK